MYVSKPKLLPWPSFTPTSSQIPFKIQTRYWKKEKGSPLESPNEFYWNINFQWRTEGHRWTVNKLNLASYKIPGCQLLNKKLIYHGYWLGDCVKMLLNDQIYWSFSAFFEHKKNRPPRSTWKKGTKLLTITFEACQFQKLGHAYHSVEISRFCYYFTWNPFWGL